jgi:LAS superfamily LD-carboxypeptidase LdcB
MATTKKPSDQTPPENDPTQPDPAQVNNQLEQQAQEKKLDEAPASGAVYIVDGVKVDVNGKPVNEKKGE